jgi:hypothetical protein
MIIYTSYVVALDAQLGVAYYASLQQCKLLQGMATTLACVTVANSAARKRSSRVL